MKSIISNQDLGKCLVLWFVFFFLSIDPLGIPARRTAHGAQPPAGPLPVETMTRGGPTCLQTPFVPNNGQTDSSIRFYTITSRSTVFITDKGEIVYNLGKNRRSQKDALSGLDELTIVFKETLRGANLTAVKGGGHSVTRIHTYLGRNPDRWRQNLPTYHTVDLGHVYDNVRLELAAKGNDVEKRFYVKPGGRINDIRFTITGARRLDTNDRGELVVVTSRGTALFTRPIAYQERNGKRDPVPVTYFTEGSDYGFSVGAYDKTRTLVIDPILSSTYLGGSAEDQLAGQGGTPWGHTLAVSEGYVYVAGQLASTDFPHILGDVDPLGDAFIAKMTEDLSQLVAVAHFGGNATDYVSALEEKSPFVYVSGATHSVDFPTTTGAYSENTGHKGFVARFSTDLTLQAATRFPAVPYDIGLDTSGSIFVAGSTNDDGFPATGAGTPDPSDDSYDTSFNGTPGVSSDGFLAKLDGNLTTLEASTFLGGSGNDILFRMALDPNGCVVVAGETTSEDFPVSPGAYDNSYTLEPGSPYSWTDGFVARLDKDLKHLEASTYLGGGAADSVYALNCDQSSVVIGGLTASPDFPCSVKHGPVDGQDAFLFRLDHGLANDEGCALIGGNGWDQINDLTVSPLRKVFVTGATEADDFPTTDVAFLSSPTAYDYSGGFVAAMDSTLSLIERSTLVWGYHETLYDIATDTYGNVVVAGDANNPGYPTSNDAFQPEHAGDRDIVVSKFTPDLTAPPRISAVEFTQAIQEFQNVEDLKNDLAADGKPPVPMVAHKPAALRVYLDRVGLTTAATVEVVGEVTASKDITLSSRCTAEDRRRRNRCWSVDFYFLPPEGSWSVTVRLLDQWGELLESHDFHLNSEKPDDLTLKIIEVCHGQDRDDLDKCGLFLDYRDFRKFDVLRAIAPTGKITIAYSSQTVIRDAEAYGDDVRTWWHDVARDLLSLYVFDQSLVPVSSGRTYYMGWVSESFPSRENGMAAGIGAHAAASKEESAFNEVDYTGAVIAHETGHMLGRRHTHKGTPALVRNPPLGCWFAYDLNTDWPYNDNMMQSGPPDDPHPEVGFHVYRGDVRLPETHFELMGYCIPQWISPFTYKKILEELQPKPPAQPGDQGTFWMVSGVLGDEGVKMRPLFAFPMYGDRNLGSGTHRLEVRKNDDSVLFTRYFTPVVARPYHPDGDDDIEGPPAFVQVIPLVPPAARIVVLDPSGVELGDLSLGGTAPTVSITEPSGGETWEGSQTLFWAVSDPDSPTHTSWVQYSSDGGNTWRNISAFLEGTHLTIDCSKLPGSNGEAHFKVYASDGANTGVALSQRFTVTKKAPQVVITAPEDGSTFRLGDMVCLEGVGWDADDGSLDGLSMGWTSTMEGFLGTGAQLYITTLSPGIHDMTLTATDSDGNEASTSITVSIEDKPLSELGCVGDFDRDGDVDGSDLCAFLDPFDAALLADVAEEFGTTLCFE